MVNLLDDDTSTRSRIVLAALRIFATRGFEAASLREITSAAQVNIAAIHYHFGSKDALVQEVLRVVSEPINRMRREALARVPAQREPTLEEVVEALIAPPVRLSFDATGEWRLLIRLLIQARALPRASTNAAIFEQYDALASDFVDALMGAQPALGREEAYWRYAFAIGAMMYIVSDADETYHRLHRISGGLCDTDDPERIVAQLVAFIAAGMRAAAPAGAPL
ncbi:MAG: hypothetical protein ABS43_24005 [Bordetella sp. SCN 67-23]|nr:MAG: hypothetical protein ABS43_24005 [Bordetella sp. SCN 67-23]ODU85490.1 MAG: hypothetical protein ABT00_09525 [Bordetella sp. SCN 68-11]OJW89183.1 MAG: hypothetical protein BGO71_21090 [Burkholderiales bacterium 67-32]